MGKTIKELVSELVYADVESVTDRDLPWEELNKKTVLVTGANGFISYYVVLALLMRNDRYQAGTKVIGLVRPRENAEKKYGEILDREDISLQVQDVCELTDCGRVDYIIHAASQASAWHFEHDPVGTINANLIGTQKVLELAVKYQVQPDVRIPQKILEYIDWGADREEQILTAVLTAPWPDRLTVQAVSGPPKNANGAAERCL